MPLYDSECLVCQAKFEHVSKIADRELVKCPVCGGDTRVLISTRGRDWFRPNELWEDFTHKPIEVTSKTHLRRLCKQYGVYSRALD